MPAKLSSIGPITINSTTIATLGWSFSPDIVKAAQEHSGLPYPTADTTSGANPKVMFRCYFQDIWALTGATILGATTFSVYLSAYTSLIRDAASIHLRLALATSCVAAIQIISASVDQDGHLIAEVEATLTANDSTTHPFAITTNNALPALTAEPIKHTLGPFVIDTVGVPGVQSASLEFAPSLQVSRTDGDLYPRIAAQTKGNPKVMVGHKDPRAVLATFGLLGANVTTSAIQYFRRYDASSGVAGAANGISVTLGVCRVVPSQLSADQGGIATQGFELTGLSSSTTHPFTVSLTATVPAAA